MQNKHPIKLKSGDEIPTGQASISWSKGQPFCHWQGKELKLSISGAIHALGIDKPDFEQLEEWVYDSVCESILGYSVEPDGIDEEGSPSWLLAMGLI